MVFHHSVLRADMALERALDILLDIYFGYIDQPAKVCSMVKHTLDKYEFSMLWKAISRKDSYDKYVRCDEPWMLTLLSELWSQLHNSADLSTTELLLLRAFTGVICSRLKSYMQPMWKRIDDYREFAEGFVDTVNSSRDWGAIKKKVDVPSKLPVPTANLYLAKATAKISEKIGAGATRREIEHTLNRILQNGSAKRNVIWIVLNIPYWYSPFKQFEFWDQPPELFPAERLSTLIGALPRAWENDVQVQAFVVPLASAKGRGGSIQYPKIHKPFRRHVGACLAKAVAEVLKDAVEPKKGG